MTSKCKYARFRLAETPSPNIPFGARSVGHHTVPARWEDTVFTVHHVCIYWGIKGTGGVALKGRQLILEPEHILVLMPGTRQVLYALDEPWEYCWWTMDGPLAEQTTLTFGLTEGIHATGVPPRDYINALESIIQGPGRRNEINASTLAYQLISVAAQYRGSQQNSPAETRLIEQATDLILASWQDSSFSIDRLARTLNIHRSTLSRRFHRVTGTTLMDYLTSVRLQNATAMLRETSLSIAEIANQCGYADPNYFSKTLKTKLGMSPTEFRKQT